jgi:hypothetical protein
MLLQFCGECLLHVLTEFGLAIRGVVLDGDPLDAILAGIKVLMWS